MGGNQVSVSENQQTTRKRKSDEDLVEVDSNVRHTSNGVQTATVVTIRDSNEPYTYSYRGDGISVSVKCSTSRKTSCRSNLIPVKRAKMETKYAAIEAKPDDGEELPVLLDGEECTICYEPYRRVEDMTFLPCAHCFHKECLDHWLAIDYACPVCRMNAGTDV